MMVRKFDIMPHFSLKCSLGEYVQRAVWIRLKADIKKKRKRKRKERKKKERKKERKDVAF